MGSKHNLPANRNRGPISLFAVIGLCLFFYILGAWQRSGFGKGDSIAMEITRLSNCNTVKDLNFETHHSIEIVESTEPKAKVFKPCDKKFTDYTPCQEQDRAMRFPRESMIYRERHCPAVDEKLHCLIPAPKGYMTPFPWPKGRDYVHYANVPYKSLTVEKANQHWVEFQGNVFKFPGGGTMFPQGADAYIDELASVIPIADGSIRTALDTGCGVASWGAYLFKRNVLAISFAPRDNHEAQIQFALERGVPAFIGVLGSIRLPFPSRSFDMAQCSRCLIPWTSNEGMYLCRLRWLNYLKPDIKRGNFTPQEQLLILELHSKWGNRWSKIAQQLPGRTDNEIKNYWRTRVEKQAKQLNIESNSKKFLETVRDLWIPRLLQKMDQKSSSPNSSNYSPPPSLEETFYQNSCGSSSSEATIEAKQTSIQSCGGYYQWPESSERASEEFGNNSDVQPLNNNNNGEFLHVDQLQIQLQHPFSLLGATCGGAEFDGQMAASDWVLQDDKSESLWNF